MKKFTFTGLLTFLMLFSGVTFGQDVVISDGFEDYADGSKIAQAAQAMGRDYWTTWDGNVGGAEDGTVTVAQAFEGTKSLKIENDNDVVLLLGDKKGGVYKISIQAYIPTGKSGYFNLLHDFAGAASEHAVEMYFNANGSTTTKVAKQTLTTATYPKDTWFPIVLDVDMNNDTAVYTLNGVEVYGWKFSLTPGGGAGLRQIAALDLYGAPTDGSGVTTTNEMYFDAIVYEQMEPEIPPVITVTPTEIYKSLKPGDIGSETVTIKNEGDGSAADVSVYIEYTPDEEAPTESVLLKKYQGIIVQGGIGAGPDATRDLEREIAISLTTKDYKIGSVIKSVRYYIDNETSSTGVPNIPISDIVVNIYGQGNAANMEGDLLATKVYPMSEFIPNDWNTIHLDESDWVTLTGEQVWIAVAFTEKAKSYPLSVDSGPVQEGGDWIRLQGGIWSRLSDGENQLSYNWAIEAIGEGQLSNAWADCDKMYHEIFARASSDLKVNFDGRNLDLGIYNATLIVLSTDVDNPEIRIPIIMDINDHTPGTNTSIKGIFVDGVAAELASGGKTEYWIEIDYTEKVDITIETEDDAATVTGDIGEQPVEAGERNIFAFKVIAEDEIHETEYLLEVTVAKKPDAINEVEAIVTVHPNPVQDMLYLESGATIELVQIYDLNGKMIQEIKTSTKSVNLQTLSTGIYLIKIGTSQGEVVRKIIKQ
ncbi:MAG: T9SS type A sorting domain-containing protein [Bacteroidales bacterium]|jgi:hypothetical protein|nr:T9SS type A sorting domain-containing protein [Bacteroidales bacterium]